MMNHLFAVFRVTTIIQKFPDGEFPTDKSDLLFISQDKDFIRTKIKSFYDRDPYIVHYGSEEYWDAVNKNIDFYLIKPYALVDDGTFVPSYHIKIEKRTIVAGPRKLEKGWTIELEQDLKYDISDPIAKLFAEELQKDIDMDERNVIS